MVAVPIRRLLLSADTGDGSWAYAVELARGLARHGVASTLAVLGERPAAADAAAARATPGLQLIAADLPPERAARTAGELRFAAGALADLAVAAGADLVQVNSPALAAADDFAVPVVAAARGCPATWWRAVTGVALPADRRWRADLAREGLARAAAAVAPTAAFAALTAAAYGRRPIVVRSGRRAAIAGPSTYGAAPSQPAFALAIGRLWDGGEGLDVLDRAAAYVDGPVVAAGPLLGPDGERPHFGALSVPGPLSAGQTARLMRTRPVYVSAARYAPDAPAALEAAQAGCALVLSDVPAHRELWGEAATLVPPGDALGFADALNRLLADARLRAERGAAARARAGRYSVDAMARGMLGVYRSVLQPPVRARVGVEETAAPVALG